MGVITYNITKPFSGTIVEVKDDGTVIKSYTINNGIDVELGHECIVLDSHSKSFGTLKIPFASVENNLGTADASELKAKYDELGYFSDSNGTSGSPSNTNPSNPTSRVPNHEDLTTNVLKTYAADTYRKVQAVVVSGSADIQFGTGNTLTYTAGTVVPGIDHDDADGIPVDVKITPAVDSSVRVFFVEY